MATLDEMDYVPSAQSMLKREMRDNLNKIIDHHVECLGGLRGSKHDTNSTQRELLQAFLSGVFGDFLAVLKKLSHVFTVFSQKLNQHQNEDLRQEEVKLSVQRAWSNMEIQSQILLCDLLEGTQNSDPIALKKEEADTLNFSFKNSISVSVVKLSAQKPTTRTTKSNGRSFRQCDLIEPSVYNIIAVYTLINEFTARAMHILNTEFNPVMANSTAEQYKLYYFSNVFITSSYLPRRKADTALTLDQILHNPHFFALGDTSEGSVMTSVKSFYKLIKSLVDEMSLLDHNGNEIMKLVEGVSNKFLNKCMDGIDTMVACSGKAYPIFSAKQIDDKTVQDAYTKDPLFMAYTEGKVISDGQTVRQFILNNKHYKTMLTEGFELDSKHLMNETDGWGPLAGLCESLLWLSDELVPLRMAFERDENRRQFSEQFEHIRYMYKRMSDKILLLLRLELHCRFVFYLSQLQSGSYWSKTESTGLPDQFVMDLTQKLATLQDTHEHILSRDRARFLWEGTGWLVCVIMTHELEQMDRTRISKKGFVRLKRDVFTIRQQLTCVLCVVGTDLTESVDKPFKEVLKLLET